MKKTKTVKNRKVNKVALAVNVVGVFALLTLAAISVMDQFGNEAVVKVKEIKEVNVKPVVDKVKTSVCNRPPQVVGNYRKGDLNHDGKITEADLKLLLSIYGLEKSQTQEHYWRSFAQYGDFNDDGVINLRDLAEMLSRLGHR